MTAPCDEQTGNLRSRFITKNRENGPISGAPARNLHRIQDKSIRLAGSLCRPAGYLASPARRIFDFLCGNKWQNTRQQVALDPVCCILRGRTSLSCLLAFNLPPSPFPHLLLLRPLPPSSSPRNAGCHKSPTSPSTPRPVSSPIARPTSLKSHNDAHPPSRLPQAKESPPIHSQLQRSPRSRQRRPSA